MTSEEARNSVFVESEQLTSPICKGYELPDNGPIDYDAMLQSYLYSGFQATNMGLAIEQINQMLHFKFTPEQRKHVEEEIGPIETYGRIDPELGIPYKERDCKIFLGCTSNLSSCGMREYIKFIVKHHLVDVIVMTAGGVEEDIIKCLAPTRMGDFYLKGKDLREKGINRIGNLLVPNDNYCLFEEWTTPVFNQMVEEQLKGAHWTPSKLARRFGREINNEDSIMYWCYKNNIPVYSPALTDGSIGDMLYFHSHKNTKIVLDIVEDIVNMNNEAIFAKQTGIIILGGGVIKHHIMNANLFREGANFAVIINVNGDYDGSDSGARPDEGVSWGKIAADAKPVKLYAEVSLVWPLIVAQTFHKFIRE